MLYEIMANNTELVQSSFPQCTQLCCIPNGYGAWGKKEYDRI